LPQYDRSIPIRFKSTAYETVGLYACLFPVRRPRMRVGRRIFSISSVARRRPTPYLI
jgi:hypothetical protein